MRDAPLTTIKGGINRLRTKGGARADDLYDFVNGYRLDGGRTRVRPGTKRLAKLDSNTRGLVSFQGELHTFCHKMVYVPPGFQLNLLVRPDKTTTVTTPGSTPTFSAACGFVAGSEVIGDYRIGADPNNVFGGGAVGSITGGTLPNGYVVHGFSALAEWVGGNPAPDVLQFELNIQISTAGGAAAPSDAFTSITFTGADSVSRTYNTSTAEVPAGVDGGTYREWTWRFTGARVELLHEASTYVVTVNGAGTSGGTTEEVTVLGSTIALEKIHFAEPFMGALYVAAEFEDGSIYHYWLQSGVTWEASTAYKAGDVIQPTVPNGIVYRAKRYGSAYPAWAPSVLRYDGTSTGYEQSIIEPTVYNDFYYTCIYTVGTLPRSGTVEPTWPTEDGATVIESSDNPPDVTTPATVSPASNTVPSAVTDRYGHWVNRAVTFTG